MPWCPKCKAEYREGFRECADCHIPLTDRKPEGGVQDTPDGGVPVWSLMDPVTVYEAKDGADAAIIREILRNADIAAAIQDSEEFGALSRIYTGSSLYGMRVLVDRSQVGQAREVLQTWARQDEHAPVSEEELARQALSGLTEEELARQAEAAPMQTATDNAAYRKTGMAVIAALAAAALLLLWMSR